MFGLDKLEKVIAGWLKPLPHLPANGQKWIATNVWWIVLVGVILSAIAALVGIGAIFAYMAFVGNAASYYGVYATSVYGDGWIISAVVSLLLSVAVVIFAAMAISPLKAMQKKGWNALFVIFMLKAVGVVLGAILTLNVFNFAVNIIFGAVGLAIGAYFLFEIHSYFGAAHKAVPVKK